jgi:hypothetical protein
LRKTLRFFRHSAAKNSFPANGKLFSKNFFAKKFSRREFGKRFFDGGLHQLGIFLALVRMPGPEKAFQPVLPAAWHCMHVEMRNTLTDPVIDRHKCSFRLHGGLNRAGQELGGFEKGRDFRGWKVSQRFVVFFGNQEAMSGKDRPMIQKSEAMLVFKYNARGHVAGDDFAEETGRLGHLGTGWRPDLISGF